MLRAFPEGSSRDLVGFGCKGSLDVLDLTNLNLLPVHGLSCLPQDSGGFTEPPSSK